MHFSGRSLGKAAALSMAVFVAAGVLAGVGKTVFADSIKIETSFPDEAFREYISSKFDLNGDGSLSDAERNAVEFIFAENKGIKTVKGIEYFPNLDTLLVGYNELKELDVSKNPSLTRIRCCDNKITELDLTKNKQLEDIDCTGSSFKTIDITGCEYLVACIKKGSTGEMYPTNPLGGYAFYEHVIDSRDCEVRVSFTPNIKPFGYCRNYIYDTYLCNFLFKEYDLDHNGWLSQAELAKITYLNISDQDVSSAMGIELMPNLQTLICGKNPMWKLDVSIFPTIRILLTFTAMETKSNTWMSAIIRS